MAGVYPNPAGGFTSAAHWARERARANRSDPTMSSQDESGFGLAGHIGYEWWVANYWGLGALARIGYARAKGDDAGGTAVDKMTVFCLSFSATYN
jgi:hypothetical protein